MDKYHKERIHAMNTEHDECSLYLLLASLEVLSAERLRNGYFKSNFNKINR